MKKTRNLLMEVHFRNSDEPYEIDAEVNIDTGHVLGLDDYDKEQAQSDKVLMILLIIQDQEYKASWSNDHKTVVMDSNELEKLN